MKKITSALLMTIMGTSLLNAGVVPKEVAQSVATNFYQRKLSASVSEFELKYTETSPTGEPVYYAFSAKGGKGFVIVSAEDAMRPIMGYSDNSPLGSVETNKNFGFWMHRWKYAILSLRENKATATADVASEWTNYATVKYNGHNDKYSINTYLCQTAWGQEYPYNTSCPNYVGSNPTYTGCVATAMGQIMKYWNFPPNGTGYNSYTYYQNPFGPLSMYFNVPINWSGMPNSITSLNTPIANLLEELGYSVDMNYEWGATYEGSGAAVTVAENSAASAQSSFTQYFYYNGTLKANVFDGVNNASWIGTIESEIKNNRPVLYAGFINPFGNAEGHAWVADGYNSSNDIHMNWGYRDSANGWFDLSQLNIPGALTVTVNGQTADFSYSDEILMGIEPSNQPFINYTAGQQPVYCTPASIALNAYDYYSPNVTFTWAISGSTLGGATITPSGTNNINATVNITPTTAGTVTVTLTASVPTGSTGFITRSTTTSFWVGLPQTAPAALTYVQAGKTCYYNAEVSAVSGATAYQWSTNGSFPAPSAGGTPTPVTTGADYDPLTYYVIYARGVNGCGAGPTSIKFDKETPGKPPGACLEDPIKTTTQGEITDPFKLLPNPANAELTIQYTIAAENTGNVNIDVYDMLGKKVENWTLPANETSATENVSDLAKGMYIYMITTGNTILQRGKVMIQR